MISNYRDLIGKLFIYIGATNNHTEKGTKYVVKRAHMSNYDNNILELVFLPFGVHKNNLPVCWSCSVPKFVFEVLYSNDYIKLLEDYSSFKLVLFCLEEEVIL